MSNEPGSVRTRRVYYFGGFDPRGAGYYHKLFSTQAGTYQNKHTTITSGPRRRSADNLHSWKVCFTENYPGQDHAIEINTTHIFMGWDDIIRQYWPRSVLAILYSFFSSYLSYASWSALNRVRRFFLPAFASGIFPFVFFVFYVVTLLLLAFLIDYFFSAKFTMSGWPSLKFLLPAAAAFSLTYFAYVVANRTGVLWLLRIYRFNILFSNKKIQGVAYLQQQWVEKIIDQQTNDPVDEIIFSGHSVGTLLLVGVVDTLLTDERWKNLQRNKKTQILTLGQCYPFITLMPAASEFRQSLQRICKSDRIIWLDVTARIDPLCFYQMHPLQNTGIDISEFSQPVLHSARFFKMYDTARWNNLKKNKMLVHFLYLMMPERPHGFNVYDIFYGTSTFEHKVNQLSHARNLT